MLEWDGTPGAGGDGGAASTNDPSVPTRVDGLGPAERVICDVDVICAKLRAGWWECLGETGLSSSPARSPERVPIDDIDELYVIGLRAFCAIARGELWCWDGFSAPDYPKQFANPVFVSKLVLGDGFVLALKPDGEVYCFGRNKAGVCGDPQLDVELKEPRRIATRIRDIRAGAGSCMLRSDGKLLVTGYVPPHTRGSLVRPSPYVEAPPYEYTLRPLPMPIPGKVRRLLPSDYSDYCCAELTSGVTGCYSVLEGGWTATESDDAGAPEAGAGKAWLRTRADARAAGDQSVARPRSIATMPTGSPAAPGWSKPRLGDGGR